MWIEKAKGKFSTHSVQRKIVRVAEGRRNDYFEENKLMPNGTHMINLNWFHHVALMQLNRLSINAN